MAKKQSAVSRIDELKHTWQGLVLSILIEGALVYGFASLAIHTGSLWFYLLAIIFALGVLKNSYELITYGNKKR
jgi:hypothetical protein